MKDREKRKKSVRRLLLLFLLFCVFEGVYQAGLYYEQTHMVESSYVFLAYLYAALALLLVFVVMNRGLSREEVTPEMVKPIYQKEERVQIAAKINRGKKRARIVLYFLIPLLLVLLLDLADLFVLTPLLRALSA